MTQKLIITWKSETGFKRESMRCKTHTDANKILSKLNKKNIDYAEHSGMIATGKFEGWSVKRMKK